MACSRVGIRPRAVACRNHSHLRIFKFKNWDHFINLIKEITIVARRKCRQVGITQLVERWTRDRKVPGLISGRNGWRIFFCRGNTPCWLFFGVSDPSPCYRSGTTKTPVILPKVQVAGYAWTRIHPWPSKAGMGWLCCPGIGVYYGNVLGKWAHTQLIRERSSEVVSTRRVIVDWFWPKVESVRRSWSLLQKKKKKVGTDSSNHVNTELWSNLPSKALDARNKAPSQYKCTTIHKYDTLL